MRVLAVEISCPHSLDNRAKKVDVEMSKIFGVQLRDILKRMQKAVRLCSMNIAPTLKVILKYGHRPGFQVL